MTSIEIVGCIAQPKDIFQNDQEAREEFTREELEQLQLDGLPVLIEHEDSLLVGKVNTSWSDPQTGNKMVRLTIGPTDNDDVNGIFATKAIQNQYLRELSLQHTYTSDVIEDSKGQKSLYVRKEPKEVSLVTKGRRPGTQIQKWSVQKGTVCASYRRTIGHFACSLRPMATEQDPPKTSPEPPSPQEETPTHDISQQADLATNLLEERKRTIELQEKLDALQPLIEEARIQKEREEQEARERQKQAEEDQRKKEEALFQTGQEAIRDLFGNDNLLQDYQLIAEQCKEKPELAAKLCNIAVCASAKNQETKANYDNLRLDTAQK